MREAVHFLFCHGLKAAPVKGLGQVLKPRKRGLYKSGISPWQAVNILVENCAMGGTYAGLGKERGEAGGIGVFHGWANGLLTEAVDSVVDILWGKLPMPEPPPAGENCTLFEQKAPELLGCRRVSTNRRGKKVFMEPPCGSLPPVDSENRFSTVDNRARSGRRRFASKLAPTKSRYGADL